MSPFPDKEQFDDILEQSHGSVTPVMGAALAFFGMLALAIILLINPRGDGSVSPAMQATRDQTKTGQAVSRKTETGQPTSGAPAETTGSAPREEIERRWPLEVEP